MIPPVSASRRTGAVGEMGVGEHIFVGRLEGHPACGPGLEAGEADVLACSPLLPVVSTVVDVTVFYPPPYRGAWRPEKHLRRRPWGASSCGAPLPGDPG